MPDAFLSVRALTKHFRVRGADQPLVALQDVDLDVPQGTTLAVIGESGSGKTTLARCLLGLTTPTSGSVLLDDQPLWTGGRPAARRTYRDVQMVFQDQRLSFNPRMTVAQTLAEPLTQHLRMRGRERADRVRELVEMVGLTADHLGRRPHQLSGGQRQRIGIARALATDPRVVVLDEPTASLDVSVRGTVLALLRELQERLGTTYVFISHDLEAVQYMADQVAILYLGAVVEQGPVAAVTASPQHPYTRALITAAPSLEYGVEVERFRLSGEIPSPIGLPGGCRLAERCPLVADACRDTVPVLMPVGAAGGHDHEAACLVTAAGTARP